MKSGNLYSVLTVSLRSQNTSYSQSRCLPHLGGTTSHKEWLGESWICQVYIRTLDLRCALRLLQRQNHPHHYCPGWLKKKQLLVASVNRDASAIKPSHYRCPNRVLRELMIETGCPSGSQPPTATPYGAPGKTQDEKAWDVGPRELRCRSKQWFH